MTDQQEPKSGFVSALEELIKQEVHREVTEHLSNSGFLHALAREIAHSKGNPLTHPHMERKEQE